MSMKVSIRIGGDVIVYNKDAYWNFVFITDTEHPVKFSVGGTQFNPLRIPGEARELRFDVPDGKREWGSGYEKIFNMGDDKLHGSTGDHSNLIVTDSPNCPADRETVRLLVAVGAVGSVAPWYPDYRYCPYPDGTEATIGHETAKYVTLIFDAEGPFNLLEGTTTIHEFPYAPGKTLEIILDNDCLGQGHPDDFLMYYDWVRDSTDKRKFFVARKPESLTMEKSVLSIEGNCDPTKIFPPPLP